MNDELINELIIKKKNAIIISIIYIIAFAVSCTFIRNSLNNHYFWAVIFVIVIIMMTIIRELTNISNLKNTIIKLKK